MFLEKYYSDRSINHDCQTAITVRVQYIEIVQVTTLNELTHPVMGMWQLPPERL